MSLTASAIEESRGAALTRPVCVSPNPVVSQAAISYNLSRPGNVTCAVYDAAGQLVDRLDGGFRAAGAHCATWDSRGVRPGVYLLKLSGTASQNLRMVKVGN